MYFDRKDMADQKTSRKSAVAEPTPGIDMKTAVKTAIVFLAELIPIAKDIRLEEVERGGPGWQVVVSYASNQSPTFAALRGEGELRIYKKIPIDGDTGEPLSLKAWK
jgi:hypothetical protein